MSDAPIDPANRTTINWRRCPYVLSTIAGSFELQVLGPVLVLLV